MSKLLFKYYPQLKQLDKFSKKIAQGLFKKYPLWFEHAQVGQYQGEFYLEIKINAPVNPSERDLILSTYNERLTVHFDLYHAHFGGWAGTTIDHTLQEAILFIEKILNEMIVVIITLQNGQVVNAGYCNTEYFDELSNDERIYTRSWKGTYDKGIRVPITFMSL